MPTAPAALAPLVTARVGKEWGRRRALHDVSITLPPGQITAILGPNGAGKSTLLGILATLVAPSSGTVRWGDQPIGRGSAARSAIGYVGHDPGLYLDLGAHKNLGLFAGLYGLNDTGERARGLLARVGLADVPAEVPVRTFSRGMLQRLALARALLHEPPILLFDEPSAALDPAGAEWLAAQLDAERAAGRVVVLVTHDLDAAAALADHIVILRRGRVVCDQARPQGNSGVGWPGGLRGLYAEACRG